MKITNLATGETLDVSAADAVKKVRARTHRALDKDELIAAFSVVPAPVAPSPDFGPDDDGITSLDVDLADPITPTPVESPEPVPVTKKRSYRRRK